QGLQNKAVYSSKHVRAELVVHAPQGIVAGQDIWLGLKIEHAPEWHTYWKNPGDVGVATELNWVLPQGLSVSEIQWPTPQILYIADDIIDYGYENTILLPVKVTVSDSFQNADVNVQLRASWLVCRVECIPEKADLSLTVPAQISSLSETGLFESFFKRTPVEFAELQAQAEVKPVGSESGEGVLTWTISGLPEHWQGQSLSLLPEQKEVIVNHGAASAMWDGDVWQAQYKLSSSRSTEPQLLSAVILPANQSVVDTDIVDQAGVRVTAIVTGTWPEQKVYEIPPSLWEDSPSVVQAGQAVTGSPASLLLILGFAALGGLLLNLMPCVFPVLSITALSFAGAGQHDSRAQKIGGLAYGAGVVATMLSLASLLLILRAGGAALGWGFQLQSPLFVSLLAGLFLLVALNLFGVYEVRVFLPQGVSNLRAKNPALDSFCSGIISVLVATPCTVPFMGAALGAALVAPAWQTLLIFLVLGIGLALPLVLLTFIPQLMRWLPAPGAWMVTFKQVMAFPMLAAVLWLVWVVGVQTGIDGVVGVLSILFAVTFLMWVLGWMQHTVFSSVLWGLCVLAFALLCVTAALYWFIPAIQQKDFVDHDGDRAIPVEGRALSPMAWGVWSSRKVDEYLKQEQTVFVDFTAAWCVTCQFNKKMTLSDEAVLKAFSDKGVVLLRADWTNSDPLITAELERLGRSGVPVYALYRAGEKPLLLPELLTSQIIFDALDDMTLKP
ncbi:MAG: protein-disulfide reductase DsbD family protein, partial [Saezia sp.]